MALVGLNQARAPVFYSTALGAKAYSFKKEPSVFTEALLVGLEGAGSDDPMDEWKVSTGQQKRAIDFRLKHLRRGASVPDQIAPADNLSDYDLCTLTEPKVPVLVEVEPRLALPDAQLEYAAVPDGETGSRPDRTDAQWDLRLSPGRYRFRARFEGQAWKDGDRRITVRPPGRHVPVAVEAEP